MSDDENEMRAMRQSKSYQSTLVASNNKLKSANPGQTDGHSV